MRIASEIKRTLGEAVVWYRHYRHYNHYSNQFKHYLALHHFENKRTEGEDAYLDKWKKLCPRVEPYSYRFFSHYCGHTPNIVPENIGHDIIEEILNPIQFRAAYEDKNLFPEIIGKEYVPRTIVCRINGSVLLDEKFLAADKDLAVYIGDVSALILKPTVGGCSGKGIIKFEKKGDEYISIGDNRILSKDFLMSYGTDFCLQESVVQHSFMSKFCLSSVNTIRLCLYRSVKDETCIVTAGIVRIGRNGSFVDNAHAGGMFIGVDVTTGVMGKFVIDQYGNKKDLWNGVDFSKNTFVVPFWSDVLTLAEHVGCKLHHHRLIALDIALDQMGKPVLFEYNIGTMSYWLFMYTNQTAFAKYTDEVIDYCKNKRENNASVKNVY